ncbi:hypothetical protein BH09SUM1_BH09SUM1_22350 [soil metagenome]
MQKEADKETKHFGLQDAVKDHPILVLGAAAGVGFLATRLISGGFIRKGAALAATISLKHYLPGILQSISGEDPDAPKE